MRIGWRERKERQEGDLPLRGRFRADEDAICQGMRPRDEVDYDIPR